jgi:hypothetical protein
MSQTNKTFKYYSFVRPLSIGTYPKGNVVDLISWIPKKKLNKFPYMEVFGYVLYDKKLSFKQIYKYELIPAEKVEYGKYMFWERSDRNLEQANKFEKMYKEMSIDELEKWKNRDHYAYFTLLIMGKD